MYSSQLGQIKRWGDIPRPQVWGQQFHWSTSQASLPKLNSNNTLYPLAYYQVLLQHLNIFPAPNSEGENLLEHNIPSQVMVHLKWQKLP
jgi:hypothetical protein